MFKDTGFQYPKVKVKTMPILLALPADRGRTTKKSAPAIEKRTYTKKKSVPAKRKHDDDEEYKPTGDKRNNKGNKRYNKKQALAKTNNTDSGTGAPARVPADGGRRCGDQECRSDYDSKRNLLLPAQGITKGSQSINGALENKAVAPIHDIGNCSSSYVVFDENLFPDKIYDFMIPADLEDNNNPEVLLIGSLFSSVNDDQTTHDFNNPKITHDDLNFNYDDSWITSHSTKKKNVPDNKLPRM